MRIGKKLRDTKGLLSVHMDVWAFEVAGKIYLQTLAREQGTLYWTVTLANGTLEKPERVLCLSSGYAADSAQEVEILAGPDSLLKALKEKRLTAFDHVDMAKQHREKEFGALMKGI